MILPMYQPAVWTVHHGICLNRFMLCPWPVTLISPKGKGWFIERSNGVVLEIQQYFILVCRPQGSWASHEHCIDQLVDANLLGGVG